MITTGKAHRLSLWAALVVAGATFAADPMPYDSIGNPLNKLPSTNRTIQWKGDSLNLVPNRVRVNQAGYRKRDVDSGYAKFYYVGTGTAFDVVTTAGTKVAGGNLAAKGVTVSGQIIADATNSAEHQNNGVGDWKAGYPKTGTVVSGALKQGVLPATLPVGKYIIKVGADTSVPFVVSDNVYGMARDAALKFFGVARSGDYESWFHPASHLWDGWLYDSTAKNADGSYKYKGALKGGWYDCGNHLKEARTNSYPLATLGMLAATMQEKDVDHFALNQNFTASTDRIPDVLREAWVGSQFVFNSWRLAKAKPDSMYLSVGDLSFDFAWWGRPENHDAVMSPTRGGRTERYLVRDWGGPSMADFAAGMAFLSRLYKPYSIAYADSALTIARAMYENAKTTKRKESSRDYTGDQAAFDDLGLAAVALLWATGETKYLKDAVITPAMPDGLGGTCKPADYSASYALSRFEGGYFGCGTNGMQYGGPTDYGSVNRLALYSFAKLILVNADTASRYGISSGMRDTLLLRTITQLPSTVWGSSAGNPILIPTGDQYNPVRLTYDSLWYSMGIGYGKSGWWNKYQFGNLADLYMFYDVTSIVEGRTILNKPGNTDWKRKEVLQVLLGGLNYMFGTNALDLSYLYGIGKKNPMHPHHRGSNPEGKNVPGAYYNYTIPVGGLYGGLLTGPSNSEKLEELWSDYRQTEANCPDAQAAVMIPLMGLAREAAIEAPRTTVKVLFTTDSMAVIQVDIDKWGTVKLGYGLDSAVSAQTKFVSGGDTGGTFKIKVTGLTPGTKYFFHVVAADIQGMTSTTSKWPNGASDSVAFNFVTKSQPALPPQYANIKVCNVTSDSAEIMWYTPNGEYLSSVTWADSVNWKAGNTSTVDTDMVGDVQVKFHHVKLYNLKPKTTYNFKVGIPGSKDPTVGCFRTPGEDVKFEIKTTHYMWDSHPALGIGVVNQDVKSYDSLQIRLYVNGTRANILDLAARVDVAFAYRTDGSTDSGLFKYTKNVQSSRPKLIDPTCPADIQSCAWYFDIPMYGAVMASQSRWRIDVLFDKHNLIRDSTELLNTAPTHDPFTGSDWSFRPHVAGADNGLSPLDYAGVPSMTKNAIDSISMDIPTNPYIAVYRRNEFVYGFSPYAVEQATKRTVYAMTASWDAPFDISTGGTIELGTGTSTRLKGTLDAYDIMLPGNKGWITSVWVNGVALSDAERKAGLTRQSDGTWKVDLPLRFATGTNKLDVTFFAGSDSLDEVATGVCQEGKGCAFVNANWYVNYVSNMTTSTISVVDGTDDALGLVVPDISTLRIRVSDGNANSSKTVADKIQVSITNLRTGAATISSLAETGVNTGVFQTDLMKIVSAAAASGQIQMVPGDTLVMKYVDAADATDSSTARVWSKASWASVSSARISAACGGTMTVDVALDKSLKASGQTAPAALGGLTLRLRTSPEDSLEPIVLAAGAWSVTGANFDHVQATVPTSVALRTDWTGIVEVKVPDGTGGFKSVSGAIADGIGPWIDSARIVENLTGNAVDTVYVWTRETAPLGKTLPVLVRRAGANVSTSGLTVDEAILADAATGKWVYAVRGGAIRAKDSLRWDPAKVSDPEGNAALDCPAMAREIKLVSRPAPFAKSWIRDADGDGQADQVSLVFRKTLVASDLPDSVEVEFGTENVVRFAKVAISMAKDSILTIPLSNQYPPGSTRGSSADGSGALKLWKSGDATGPFALLDSVGPVLLSAKLRFANGTSRDTLDLEFSEPVRRSSGSGWLVLKPDTDLGADAPDSVSATSWKLPVDTSTVFPGDFVRPLATGKWSDASNGNRVGSDHVWVVVTGGERAPVGGWFNDTDGDGAVDQATVVFGKTPRALNGMELSWPSRSGFSVAKIDSGTWTLNDDGLTATMSVGPFAQGITSTETDKLGRWISNGTTSVFPMEDRVAPVIVSAMLRYASEDTLSDTLVVRWSEKLAQTAGQLVFHGNSLRGVLPENVNYLDAIVDPDGLGAALLLGAGQSALRKGDSAKLAASVKDRSGNQVVERTAWVPVSFGLRPPRLKTELRPMLVHDEERPIGTGPALQTWVWDKDNEKWLRPDGSVPEDVDSTHFASLSISLNQVLEGSAHIFDKAGTFVASSNFDGIRKMAAEGKLPMDASGGYLVKFVWDGRAKNGKLVASGVYYMRLVLKFQIENLGKPRIVNQVYTLGFKRAVK